MNTTCTHLPSIRDLDGDITEGAWEAAQAVVERACDILEKEGLHVEIDQGYRPYGPYDNPIWVASGDGRLIAEGPDGKIVEAWVDLDSDIPAEMYGWSWGERTDSHIDGYTVDGCTAREGTPLEEVAQAIADGVSTMVGS